MLGRGLISGARKPSKIVDLVLGTALQGSDPSELIYKRFSDYDGKMSIIPLRQGLIYPMTASPSFRYPVSFGDVTKFLADLDLNSHLKYAPLSTTLAALISDEEASSKQPTQTLVEEWEEVSIDDLVNELERERAGNCQLQAEIAQLEAKNAQLEETVREDVCEEMRKQIQAMEHAFQVRIEDERIAMEHKFKLKLQIFSREITRRANCQADGVIRQLETKIQDLEDQRGQAHVAALAYLPAPSTEEDPDVPLNHPAKPEEPAAPLDLCAESTKWWGDVLLDRINKHVEHMRQHGVLAGRHPPRRTNMQVTVDCGDVSDSVLLLVLSSRRPKTSLISVPETACRTPVSEEGRCMPGQAHAGCSVSSVLGLNPKPLFTYPPPPTQKHTHTNMHTRTYTHKLGRWHLRIWSSPT
jgi:hypothetical protein